MKASIPYKRTKLPAPATYTEHDSLWVAPKKCHYDWQDPELMDPIVFANMVIMQLGLNDKGLSPNQKKAIKAMKSRHRYIFIAAHRAFGKSVLTQIFTLWTLYWYPETKVMIISQKHDRAKEMVTFLLNCLENLPMFEALRPQPGDRQQKTSFDISHKVINPSPNPSVMAAGITGSIQGNRANLLILDDICGDDGDTDVGLRNFEKVMTESEHILYDAGWGKKVICLGTYFSPSSPLLSLESRGYVKKTYPALTNYNRPQERAADPDRLDIKTIRQKQKVLSKQAFQLHYQLLVEEGTLEDFPLKLKDLMVIPGFPDYEKGYDQLTRTNEGSRIIVPGQRGEDRLYLCRPSEARGKYDKVMAYLDPAEGRKGGDECICVIGGSYMGTVFLLDFVRLNGFGGGELDKLNRILQQARCSELQIETNFGGSPLVSVVKSKVKGMKITPIKSTTNKVNKIIGALLPALEQGRLAIFEEAAEKDSQQGSYSFLQQLIFVSSLKKHKRSLKHDDRVESVACLVNAFENVLALDGEVLREQKYFDAIQKEIDEIAGVSNSEYLYANRGIYKGGRRW